MTADLKTARALVQAMRLDSAHGIDVAVGAVAEALAEARRAGSRPARRAAAQLAPAAERVPGRMGGRWTLIGQRFPLAQVLTEVADTKGVEEAAARYYQQDPEIWRCALRAVARAVESIPSTPPAR